MPEATLKVFRGTSDAGEFKTYKVPVEPGMVVLDAIHYIQRELDPDLAVRWNCKAAKCGSCSAEINGMPALMCKSRLDRFAPGEEIVVEPLRTFPLVKDLVSDVSWNFDVISKIEPFKPKDSTTWSHHQEDIDRVQEFRKCIECFCCQDVCHVLRDHKRQDQFIGPCFFVYLAGLEMHPQDCGDRLEFLKKTAGIGYCNITKCCSDVCPENIAITDNAIIPLKERVVDKYFDPIMWVFKKLFGKGKQRR